MGTIELAWSKVKKFTQEFIDQVPEEPGVYRFSEKNIDGHYYVFFVGHAENLREKLSQHFSDGEPNEELKQRLSVEGADIMFKYAQVLEKNVRDSAVIQMNRQYAPEVPNDFEYSSSSSVTVNLN